MSSDDDPESSMTMEVDAADDGGGLPDPEDLAMRIGEDGAIRLGGMHIPPPPPPALTFDSDRPRLVITHIENENFKSYAGVQTLGPFHKSFTSIVGPNGSGKSNVIDSMLFVFGYRAQQIRSKKISVLIHESQEHPNCTSCSVRVFFQDIIDDGDDNEEGTPVDGTQFSVGRTAFKDNSSHYDINGKKVPFKEVSQLLRKKGVDLDHNRFLILQGEVEQIAQMKPKALQPNDTGMLEFLEDIIGSSRFKEPIEVLKRTVEELDELRGEKLNRVKLVEKEKDELEEPKNKALEFIRLENNIVEKKNIGYQQYIMSCEKKIEAVEKAKAEFEESAKDVLANVEKLAAEKKAIETEHTEKISELKRTRADVEEAQQVFKTHELEDTKLREEMKNLNVKRKKLMHLAKVEEDKHEKLLAVPEENQGKIEECSKLKSNLERTVEEEQKKYDEGLAKVKEETQVHQDEKEQLETKLIDLRKVVNEKESALRIVQSKLSVIESNEQKEKTRLEQLVMAKSQNETRYKEANQEDKALAESVPKLQKEVGQGQQKLEELSARESELSKKVSTMRRQYEEQKYAASANKSRGRVIEAIMEQKQSGKIPGIFGRLGDLGSIDKEYDVAISTATGSGLDTILVDTVETAKACIEYLRRHNVGRGNFLSLNKTTRWEDNCSRKTNFPENVQRLFDLIQPREDKFRTAFYHTLRDTLVTKTMEQAQRIAFGAKRYRVVTTSGEIIETSGAMSGGGSNPIRGKMGSVMKRDASDAGYKLLETNLKKFSEELREITQQKTELEMILRNKQKEFEHSRRKQEALQNELKVLKDKLANADGQIKKQEQLVKKAKPDDKETAKLRKEIEAAEKECETSKERSSGTEQQVKQLNSKIKEIMGGKLKSISKKLDEAKTQLDKIKAELTRLEVGIKSAERDVGKSKEKLDTYRTEITEVENKMKAMRSQRDTIEEKGKEALTRLTDYQQGEKEIAESVEKLSHKIRLKEEEATKYKSQQLEINQELEKFDNEMKEQGKNCSHWRRELKKLRLREVPFSDEDTEQELKIYEPEELKELDMKKWQYELNLMEERISTLKVNFTALDEYRKKEEAYLRRVGELEDISSRKEKQRKNHEELRKHRLTEFMNGFSVITGKLKEMYQMITLGGDAELELVDSLDPFTEGIVFSVRPPSKSWKNISNLSGGEKTLSSLALVFALHFYKPTPLYVMDEIDAALDFKNVSIVANYIRERTKNAQFIIISLRSNMFEIADRLVGIYKTYNCTKSVTINPAKVAAASAK